MLPQGDTTMSDTPNDTSEAIASAHAIAERFGETHRKPIAKLIKLATVFGAAWMLQVAERAEQEISTAGPRSRRTDGQPRTRGGVFFSVAQQAAFEALDRRVVSRKAVLGLFGHRHKPAQPAAPPPTPSDRSA